MSSIKGEIRHFFLRRSRAVTKKHDARAKSLIFLIKLFLFLSFLLLFFDVLVVFTVVVAKPSY